MSKYWQVENAAAGCTVEQVQESRTRLIEHLSNPATSPADRSSLGALAGGIAVRRDLKDIDAASRGDRLPAQLSDVAEVPIPGDPETGKAFSDSVSGDRAELKSSSIPIYGPLEFELRLAP